MHLHPSHENVIHSALQPANLLVQSTWVMTCCSCHGSMGCLESNTMQAISIFWTFWSLANRQLAKLLSGNEVRGKVAIAAVQMTVNFTRSLSRWPRKFFEHIFSVFGKIPTLKIYLQSFASSRRIFFGEEGDLFAETTVHGPQGGSRDRAGLVMFCCAIYCSSLV